MDTIDFEEFKKVEIRMGKVVECEKVEGADKLLKLQVDFGPAKQDSTPEKRSDERMIRQIISGIAQSYKPEEMIGKTLPFIVNLEYRRFRGVESQGMLIAVDAGEKTVLLEPNAELEPGAEVV